MLVKWAGGKAKLAPLIIDALGIARVEGPIRYTEPFLGGASVLAAVQRCRVSRTNDDILAADINAQLMATYHVVGCFPEMVAGALARMPERTRETYAALRAELNSPPEGYDCILLGGATPPPEAAVRAAAVFLWVNRACFNGLYRVNRKGKFNVPIGDGKVALPSREDLLVFADMLRGVRLRVLSYRDTLNHVTDFNRPAFVYADPPYAPLTDTADFTGYAAGGFGPDDHADLASRLTILARHDVRVVASNHDTPYVRMLYSDPVWTLTPLSVARSIAAKGAKRAPAPELLISGGPLPFGPLPPSGGSRV